MRLPLPPQLRVVLTLRVVLPQAALNLNRRKMEVDRGRLRDSQGWETRLHDLQIEISQGVDQHQAILRVARQFAVDEWARPAPSLY